MIATLMPDERLHMTLFTTGTPAAISDLTAWLMAVLRPVPV
jgi:hypothetical protein